MERRNSSAKLQEREVCSSPIVRLAIFLCLGWFSSGLIAGDSEHLCTGGETDSWLRGGSSLGRYPPSQSGCDDSLFKRVRRGEKWHAGGSHPHTSSAPEPFWINPWIMEHLIPLSLPVSLGPILFCWLPTSFLRELCLLRNPLEPKPLYTFSLPLYIPGACGSTFVYYSGKRHLLGISPGFLCFLFISFM